MCCCCVSSNLADEASFAQTEVKLLGSDQILAQRCVVYRHFSQVMHLSERTRLPKAWNQCFSSSLTIAYFKFSSNLISTIFTELSGVETTKIYSYKELRRATEDFSPANKIGEGGFGSVYRVIEKTRLLATGTFCWLKMEYSCYLRTISDLIFPTDLFFFL